MSRPVLCPSFAFFLWTLSLCCLDLCLVPALSCVLLTPDSCPLSLLSKNDPFLVPTLSRVFLHSRLQPRRNCFNTCVLSQHCLVFSLQADALSLSCQDWPVPVPNLSCVLTPDWCSVSLLSRLTRALSQTCLVFFSTPAVGPVPVMSCALVHSSLVPCLTPVYTFAMSQPCRVLHFR